MNLRIKGNHFSYSNPNNLCHTNHYLRNTHIDLYNILFININKSKKAKTETKYLLMNIWIKVSLHIFTHDTIYTKLSRYKHCR